AEPVRLCTDDALLLDDGNLVEVVAEAEPLIEARAADPGALARLAWHLGDRHVPVEIMPNRLRVRREPEIEALLVASGAKGTSIEARFEPEGGAYAVGGHHHEHHHGHDEHDQSHDHHHDHHHDHAHGHGHHHDHHHDHHHGHDHHDHAHHAHDHKHD